MCLNFYTVYDLILTLEFFILAVLVINFLPTQLLVVFLGKLGLLEFKVPSVELQINKFINQLANNFAMPLSEGLNFDIFDIWEAEILQVFDHLSHGVIDLTLEVFEIDEYPLFFILKTGNIRNSILKERLKESITYLFLVKAHEPVNDVVHYVDSLYFFFVVFLGRMSEVDSTYSLVLPPSTKLILII